MSPIDFESAVVERSHEVPVVIDFWAPWCAPCRTLGPILEALADQAGGHWELVKIDSDEQPELAQSYDVRGIPAVKMLHRGEVIGEFVGALPESDVRRWLDEHLPDPRKDRLAELAAHWVISGGSALVGELEKLVEENPDLSRGRLLLAQALVVNDPQRARELADDDHQDAEDDELATDVRSLAALMERSDDIPERVAPSLEAAREALRRHDLEAALDGLVEAVGIDLKFADEMARRAAVALFRRIGQDDERTRTYQRRLAMVLNA